MRQSLPTSAQARHQGQRAYIGVDKLVDGCYDVFVALDIVERGRPVLLYPVQALAATR